MFAHRPPHPRGKPSGPACRFRPQLEALEDRALPSTSYHVVPLVSDQAGVAPVQDSNLVNAWGIAVPPSGNFWISDNGKDVSTLYNGDVGGQPLAKQPLVVSLPGGSPTGQVFNPTSDFVVQVNGTSMPAFFITASESGHITGWAPGAGPGVAMSAQDAALVPHAVFKGITLVSNAQGNFLLASDFHNNKIDVFDKNFHLVHAHNAFVDSRIPHGFAPFNVQNIHGKVYVTYAKQDADRHDDAKGAGNGFVDVFSSSGRLLSRLASHGVLNSPWGVVVAPSSFGRYRGAILIGNFGDGKVNAFSARGHDMGTLQASPGHPLVIDGLWALTTGNGTTAGAADTVYFTAGPGGESHGLFGKIVVRHG